MAKSRKAKTSTLDEDKFAKDVSNMPPDLQARCRMVAATRIKELLDKAGEMGRLEDVLMEGDPLMLDDLLIVSMVHGAAHLAEKAIKRYGAKWDAAPMSPLRRKAIEALREGKLGTRAERPAEQPAGGAR